ncbi:glycosyltransferase WbuB [Prescottella equi]|uniref:glycosyltransferase family 4 protein n=1 Tax=Rhodococcus hoagii TaxID=43767 RepID=UPI000A12303E|nr:glycosyltransferase family 4 protein [Prescottella equi]ORL02357.1 glycosyltransferase WbuB [Prescottella equi]
MRISIIGLNYAPELSGNAPYTAGLARGLSLRGHDVDVLTGYPHYPGWKVDPNYTGISMSEIIEGVPVTRFRHFVPRKPTPFGRVLLEASFGARIAVADWKNPDVVLCVSPALISSGLAIVKNRISRARVPIGVLVQDLYSRGIVETGVGGQASGRLGSQLESSILRSASGISVIHEKFREHARDRLGVPDSKITVIHNWTHLKPVAKTDRIEMRRLLGWGDDEIVVLHAGNMGVKQGLENVVEAARLADSTTPSVRFVLLGDGNQRTALEKSAAGVRSLEFVNPLPDGQFQKALAAADVLLVNEMPGVAEMSLPSKLTSYFTTGLPVLAACGENGTTAATIARSGGGLRVDPGEPESLLRAALTLSSDPRLAAAIGNAGKNFCERELGETQALDQYESWLSKLASNGCGRRKK